VSDGRDYQTPQEAFWAGDFGSSYSARNASADLLASNVHFFSTALRKAGPIQSCLELGANVGMNLKALKELYPALAMRAVEINVDAARALGDLIGAANVHTQSIFDYQVGATFDLVLVKGVLIHINPDMLPVVYEKLFAASHRFILIGEYYNPSPVAVAYRGHTDRLFKRDFAGEMLDRYPQLALVDYGFVYRRDPAFPQDDVTWFLLEKRS
jgi:pseudaminic acid biosynthesis-associated methylase